MIESQKACIASGLWLGECCYTNWKEGLCGAKCVHRWKILCASLIMLPPTKPWDILLLLGPPLCACRPRVAPCAVCYITLMGSLWLLCRLFWRPNTDNHFSFLSPTCHPIPWFCSLFHACGLLLSATVHSLVRQSFCSPSRDPYDLV